MLLLSLWVPKPSQNENTAIFSCMLSLPERGIFLCLRVPVYVSFIKKLPTFGKYLPSTLLHDTEISLVACVAGKNTLFDVVTFVGMCQTFSKKVNWVFNWPRFWTL